MTQAFHRASKAAVILALSVFATGCNVFESVPGTSVKPNTLASPPTETGMHAGDGHSD